MSRTSEERSSVLRSSRSYYANRAQYLDLLAQRRGRDRATVKQLDFLERTFEDRATRPVHRILDVACGGGRHVVGLAERGYECVGQDFTSDRVTAAKARAERAGVSIRLHRGDATRLPYASEFDAVLALYILFLLPSDEDVQRCIRQASRSLRRGGVFVCNVLNPFSEGKMGLVTLARGSGRVETSRAPGIRFSYVHQLRGFDRVHGWGWLWETSTIEAPDGRHVFRDRERFRFLTYSDVVHFLEAAGFRDIACHPDWSMKQGRRPKAEELVFTARK